MEGSFSSSSPSHSWDMGKLFVGGISWETDQEALRDYFNKYGDVAEAVAVKDRATGNPRGFAFVLFSDPETVERVLNDKDPHVILGRTVEVKRARPRSEQHQYQNRHENGGQTTSSTSSNSSYNRRYSRSKKIFVGGLPSEVTEDVFKAYFEDFGNVIDAVVIFDNVTRRSRGFGFIEFDSEQAVDRVMQKDAHELNNKHVEVKIAVPKDGYNRRNVSSSHASNASNYNSSPGAGLGLGYYQGGVYPTYDPRIGWFHYYPPPVGYGGGFAIGVDGRVGYGAPIVTGPRRPWNDQGMGGVRQDLVPYGGANLYPVYYNGFGGYSGVATGGYYGMLSSNDKVNQIGSDVQTTSVTETVTSQVENLTLEAR